MDIIENLKEYKRLKTELARKYCVTQQELQKAMEEIVNYILSKSDKTITSAEVIELATSETSAIHKIFDIAKSQEDKEKEADELIKSVSIFLSSNKLYILKKQ